MSEQPQPKHQQHKRKTESEQIEETPELIELKKEWTNYQLENSKKIILKDSDNLSDQKLKYVGGLDITYSTTQPNLSIGCLAICEYPSCKLLHSITIEKEVTVPYIPGFLAFKENVMYKELLQKCKEEYSDCFPQLFMIDGNGIYHPRRFGSACQIGIENDVPTLGVAKTVLYVDGITRNMVTEMTLKTPHGGTGNLYTENGEHLCTLIRSGEGKHPILVSPGHKISMKRSVEIVQKMLIHKIPEPIFLADKLSRKVYTQEGKLEHKKRFKNPKKMFDGK